ncbi:protein 5NUC-like [Uranotaenia lowii]|uniref:protein 5NUC-like n=1 Tax=Uranotaenia lowii TaxID=190385 RepID=UPI002479665D|nr:protein 5NUC-like [Uranotaenia lowii]XP_055602282.1 protein 5NUC-like [Uranotaenia lowii]XP_055602283.1 protein 5NUC-like [Uranotaenia lowii]
MAILSGSCFVALVLLGMATIEVAPKATEGKLEEAAGSRARAAAENFQLIILHNNDMHARFEQTGAYGNDCQPADVANNRCYGGFARVAHK